jgi:hypothetical protein
MKFVVLGANTKTFDKFGETVTISALPEKV